MRYKSSISKSIAESLLEGYNSREDIVGTIKSTGKGFYVGDPCYALADEDYYSIWGDEHNFADGLIHLSTGDMLVHGTAYGDGDYPSAEGHFPVDSGTLCIMDASLVKKNIEGLGKIIPGEEASLVVHDGTFDISIKNPNNSFDIITAYEEEEEDDYWEEEMEESVSIKKNLKNNKLDESATEEYWDATEIYRDGFASLLKFNFGTDANGNNYIITIDNNEAERLRANSDEEAIEIYNKWKEQKDSGLVDYDFNNHYEKIGESEEVKRDLAIEPGSEEEEQLDSLYNENLAPFSLAEDFYDYTSTISITEDEWFDNIEAEHPETQEYTYNQMRHFAIKLLMKDLKQNPKSIETQLINDYEAYGEDSPEFNDIKAMYKKLKDNGININIEPLEKATKDMITESEEPKGLTVCTTCLKAIESKEGPQNYTKDLPEEVVWYSGTDEEDYFTCEWCGDDFPISEGVFILPEPMNESVSNESSEVNKIKNNLEAIDMDKDQDYEIYASALDFPKILEQIDKKDRVKALMMLYMSNPKLDELKSWDAKQIKDYILETEEVFTSQEDNIEEAESYRNAYNKCFELIEDGINESYFDGNFEGNEVKLDLKNDETNPVWIVGDVQINGDTYRVNAKVFQESSEFGIDKGPVSKLWVEDSNRNTIINYDRGWDIKPTEENQEVYNIILGAVKSFRNNNLYESYDEPKKVQEKTATLSDGTKVRFITYRNSDGTYYLSVMSDYETQDEFCGDFKDLSELDNYIDTLIKSDVEDNEELYYVNYIKESVDEDDDYKDSNYKVDTSGLVLTNGGYGNNCDTIYGRIQLIPKNDSLQPGNYSIIYFCENDELFVFELGADVQNAVKWLYELDGTNDNEWIKWDGMRIQLKDLGDVLREDTLKDVSKEQTESIMKAINNAYYNEEPLPLNRVNYR